MAILDYDGLTAEAKVWAARSDSVFSNRMPIMVSKAEARIYDGMGKPGEPLYSAPLRVKTMEHSSTVAVTAGEGALPDDYVAARRMSIDGNRVGLDYLPPERIEVLGASLSSGDPGYWTVEGSTLKIVPAYTGNVDLAYYRRFDALTSEYTGDHPLLRAHDTIYLEAVLIEAFAFLQNMEMAIAHASMLRGLVDAANRAARDARTAGARMRIQPRRVLG